MEGMNVARIEEEAVVKKVLEDVARMQKFNMAAQKAGMDFMKEMNDLHKKWFRKGGFYKSVVGKMVVVKVDRLYCDSTCMEESESDHVFPKRTEISAKVVEVGYNADRVYRQPIIPYDFLSLKLSRPQVAVSLGLEHIKIVARKDKYIENPKFIYGSEGPSVLIGTTGTAPWYIRLTPKIKFRFK